MTRAIPFLALLVGCATLRAAIPGERFEPPARFAELWRQVHEDLGMEPGDMAGIRWYLAETGTCLSGDGTEEAPCTRGVWLPGRIVVLAEDGVSDEGLVMHEMLHDILGGDREHRHPLFAKYRSQPEGR